EIRSTSAATCCGSVWSTLTGMPTPPRAVTRSAVSSMVSGRSISERPSRVLRPVTYTVAPTVPNSSAMARPAPRVPPATSATWSFNGCSVMHVTLAEGYDKIPRHARGESVRRSVDERADHVGEHAAVRLHVGLCRVRTGQCHVVERGQEHAPVGHGHVQVVV